VSAARPGKRARREQFECPNCGADVAVGAKACRECGSDASTGWQTSDEIDYAQVDIPDGYRGERDSSDAIPPGKRPLWWVLVALLVAAALLALTVLRW
jgi:hypothetical protein